MKNSNKNNQVVKVIINNDNKPKRRKYKRKAPTKNDISSIDGNSIANAATYNPATSIFSSPPSYGLKSVNPILGENPILTNISDTIKNLDITPKLDEYKTILEKDLSNKFTDDINDKIRNTLLTQGRDYLDDYLSQNNVVSRANTAIPSIAPSVLEDIDEEEPRGALPVKTKIKLRYKPGRPPNIPITKKELIQYNIDRTQAKLNVATKKKQNGGIKKMIEKLNMELKHFLQLRENLKENEEGISPEDLQQLYKGTFKNKND